MNERTELAKEFYLSRYRLVIRMAFDAAPAAELGEDILHEAYIEFMSDVMESPEMTITDENALTTLLRRVVHRVGKRYWRLRQRQSPDALRELGEKVVAARNARADRIENEDQLERHLRVLNLCREQLPEKSRNLIRLHYQRQLTVPEIAGRMNLDPRAVYQAICRIRVRLKNCIRERLKIDAK